MKTFVFEGFGMETEMTVGGVRFTAWAPQEVSDELGAALRKRSYFKEKEAKRRGRPPKEHHGDRSAD